MAVFLFPVTRAPAQAELSGDRHDMSRWPLLSGPGRRPRLEPGVPAEMNAQTVCRPYDSTTGVS